VPDIIEHSKEKGLLQIAITDHVRKDSVYFKDYIREIRAYSYGKGLDVLIGFEAKITDTEGGVDMPPEAASAADIKIASVHRMPQGKRYVNPADIASRTCQQMEFDLSMAAIEKKGFDILGHAGGMSLAAHNEFNIYFFKKIISACSEKGIVFEINSFYHKSVCIQLTEFLKEYNPFVSLGSDAHTLPDIGTCTDMVKQMIKGV